MISVNIAQFVANIQEICINSDPIAIDNRALSFIGKQMGNKLKKLDITYTDISLKNFVDFALNLISIRVSKLTTILRPNGKLLPKLQEIAFYDYTAEELSKFQREYSPGITKVTTSLGINANIAYENAFKEFSQFNSLLDLEIAFSIKNSNAMDICRGFEESFKGLTSLKKNENCSQIQRSNIRRISQLLQTNGKSTEFEDFAHLSTH